MNEIIIIRDGRPDDLIETREFPLLAGSMLERPGIVRDGGLHRVLCDGPYTARAVAVVMFLILAVGLTRLNWDLCRDRLFAGIASRTGDGAQTQVETA